MVLKERPIRASLQNSVARGLRCLSARSREFAASVLRAGEVELHPAGGVGVACDSGPKDAHCMVVSGSRARPYAHTGSRTRVTSMGGLYDAATLCALTTCCSGLPKLTRNAAAGGGGMEPKGPGLGPGLGLACSWLQGTRGPCLVCTWSHAGLNRGPYGYWPYALTS